MSLHDPRAVFARLWRFFRLAMRRKIASLQGFGRATVLIPAKNGENGRKRSGTADAPIEVQRATLRTPACDIELASRITASHSSTYYGQWLLAFSKE